MDKRYQFTIDGKTYFKNVAPENEEKFFELYGEYNPTLVSDEVGKSQGTSQSQNNQQENTESKSEDGSSELPSWYDEDVVKQMNQKRYDTQGNIVKSQKDEFGNYTTLTSDQVERDRIKKQNAKKREKEQELKYNLSEKNKGLYSFIVGEDLETTSNRANEFFKNDKDGAVVQLESMFGDIYSYEETGDRYNSNQVKITHKESGESTVLDFGLNKLPFKQKEVDRRRNNSSNNLINFLENTLSDEDKLNSRIKQGKLVSEVEALNMDLTKQQKQDIRNKYASVDQDGNAINQDLFKPYMDKRYAQGVKSFQAESYEVEYKPYESELKEAKQQLIREGYKEPTREQIEKVARENLITKDTNEAKEKKIVDIMNSDEVEGDIVQYMDHTGQVVQSGTNKSVIDRVKIGSLLKNEKDIKELAAYELNFESKIEAIENNPNTKVVGDMIEFFNDPTARFAIGDGEEYVTLDDGRKIPKDRWEQYEVSNIVTKASIENFEEWINNNSDKIENLQDSDYKNNLIQKNYNDWEKFTYNVGSGFSRIITKGGYGASKIGYALVGVDNKALDKTMLSIDEANAIYRESFQPDVKFENAFKKGNFGKFLAQEIGNQIPIFATIAIPTIGIPSLGFSSAGDNWTDMLRKDAENPGNESSLLKKTLTSAGYGTAEVVFDRFLTLPVMKRSWANMYGTSSKNMQAGLDGIKQHFVQNGKRQLMIDPLLEMSSEVGTTITQNLLTGKPITENLAHSAFSGGMFGTIFGGTPFVKGVMMNTFSNSEVKQKYRDNLSKITDLKTQLDGTKRYIKPETAKILNEQIDALEKENNQILENVENQMKNMSPKFVQEFLKTVSAQEVIRNQAKKITNDSSLDAETKRKALENLQNKFDKNQVKIDMMKDPKVFGNKYNGFLASDSKEDVDRREKIIQEAYNNLVEGGNSNPSDAQVQEEGRLIYNTQYINNDYKNKRGKTKLGKSLRNYQTVEQAVEEINKMNIDQKEKDLLISKIENGSHGANVKTKDGERIPFQVVENMAKDDRLETRTHELGHTIFEEVFGKNPEAFVQISNQILQHVKSKNPNLYALLLAETDGKSPEEVLNVYMEMVVEGKIDFGAKKNSGLGGLMGYLFGKGVAKETNSDFDFDFEGETDAVAFITNLAKKIKAGTVTIKDIKSMKKSTVSQYAQFIDEMFNGNESEFKTKLSENISKSNLEIAAINEKIHNEIKENAKIKGIGLDEVYYENDKKFYKAVSDRFRNKLIRENMAIANKLAKRAYEGGVMSGTKRVSLEEFQSGFFMELADLGRTWNPAEGVPFGAYVNKILPTRYNQILDEAKGQGPETVSISTPEGDIDIADTDIVAGGGVSVQQAEGKIVNKELGLDSKKVSEIENTVKEANVPLSKLTYKGVKKLITNGPLNKVLDIVSKDFGVDANRIRKNQDLDGKQREAARDKIVELSKKGKLIDMLPEGTDRSGKATGVAPSLLNKFYIKGGRAKVKEGATAAGLPIQVKKPNVTNKDFLAAFGINPDGTNKKGTSLDGALRAFITQVAQLEANQQIRKNAIEQGIDRATVEKVGEGKSEVMFSEKVNLDLSLEFKKNANFNTRKLMSDLGVKSLDVIHVVEEYLGGKNKDITKKRKLVDFIKSSKLAKQIRKDLGGFLKKHPQYIPYFQASMASGYGNSLFGVKDVFYEITGLTDDNIKKLLTRYAYAKGEKLDKDKIKIEGGKIKFKKGRKWIDQKEFLNDNKSRLDLLEDMFTDIRNYIQDNKGSASVFALFAQEGANTQNHVVKIMSPLTVVPYKNNNINYMMVREEHSFPQNKVMTILLAEAIKPDGNIKKAMKVVKAAYSQWALDLFHDDMVADAGFTSRMPDVFWEDIIPRILNGKLDYLPDGLANIVRYTESGIDLNGYYLLSENMTVTEYFGVNVKGLNKAQMEHIVPIQNELIKRILTGEITKQKATEQIKAASKVKHKKSPLDVKHINDAIEADLKKRGYTFDSKLSEKSKGMSTFDFDETLIIDGENFVIATNPLTGQEIEISSADWPIKGPELMAEGYEMNFDDFVNVRGGVDGPLLQKMKNQIKKYGPNNVFVLTARPQQAATAIDGWLKSKGINIPFKNITGLADSRGEAKANWMLEKFAEGYNDMYFVDDALPNVKAVKDVLKQLDIKSKVVQARIKFSEKGALDFNKILEESKGVDGKRRFSAQEARKIGAGKGRFKFFVPPSAEDFKGLLYSFLGKGREGDAHAAWFKEHLLDPFSKGIREWNTYKQSMSDDYQALKKEFKGIGKILDRKVEGTVFTNDNAIRVYLWNKSGFEIPGVTESQIEKLVNQVENNPELKAFADALSIISRVPEGYIQPEGYWAVQSIASDLNSIVLEKGRKDFLAEWIENKNIIFSEQNLNKIEAIYGTDFRDALENMLYRMETGSNRPGGKSKHVNMWLDWINGSVAATMFFNMRSATLQTISMVNFINMSDNNIFKAAAAFANQPQFWKDFAFIFNSPMLKQRRAGLQIDVSASEITKAFNQGKSKPEAILAFLLEKGFTPTQIADSFAISMGGSTFYRNRIKKYIKDGMSEAKAKEQAWLDFQEIAEETQQSSRPDLISMQQAGPMGRLILAWQNTPMQMTRLTKKKLSDLVNRRRIPGYTQLQSDMANIQGIIYYGVVQNLIFGAMQTGLMFLLFGWDEDEERKKKLELRTLNGALDTLLRGTGIYGAAISTLKNVLLKWKEEREGPAWKRDDWNIAQEAINLSPPIGSKMRKLMGAIRTEKYNPGVSKEIGFRIENPNLSIAANWTEALTNIPVARVVNKANNVEEALNSNHDIWQRVAMASGWSRWSVGVEDEELKAAKETAKEKREQKKKEERKKKKEEKKKEEQKKAPKRYKCRKRKADGNRCKNTTTHKSQYCYAHR